MGDLNLNKVLDEISKIDWDCLIRKTTILITRNILSRFGNIFTQPIPLVKSALYELKQIFVKNFMNRHNSLDKCPIILFLDSCPERLFV